MEGMQGVAIRFRTDQNNQRYGFGLTITREMTKTKSPPEGINVFFYLIKFLIIDVYINLCLHCQTPRQRQGGKSVYTAQRQKPVQIPSGFYTHFIGVCIGLSLGVRKCG